MWSSRSIVLLLLPLNFFLSLVGGVVLHTSSRWIVDSNNKRVKLRCANWAGHMETYIPEGLQHQPVATIASWLSTNKFNCVRLTFSIDMALSPNTKVSDAFTNAASPAGVSVSSMQSLYNTAVSKNPWLSTSTVQGAFAKVVDELAAKNILVVLDNHVSKASWCCGMTDGNGWWDQATGYNADNSRFFNTANWLSGLRAMATFAKSHPNIVGIGMRNEIRAANGQDGNNHADWYKYVGQGAAAIYGANKDLLIILGGVSYGTDLGYLYSKPFDRSPYPNKVVWEYHNYEWTYSTSDCNRHKELMGQKAGYLLSQNQAYTGPLWVSEFGWAQNSPTAAETAYVKCLVSYLESNDADWAYWALMGSYYVRDKTINRDETFGLLNANWSGWRNSSFPTVMGKLFSVTQGP